GIEVVLDHPERRFGQPAAAAQRLAARRAHHARACGFEGRFGVHGAARIARIGHDMRRRRATPMQQSRSLSAATLGALGVVYGDIGTSPLYALREATAVAGGTADVTAMLGVLSLIFWSLLIIISLKYLVFILRMDNDGEGGVLSLVALVESK